MKKRELIALVILICSIIAMCLILIISARRDKTVLKQIIDDSCTILIRAERYWEVGVPVYLEIHKKGEKTLTSTPFAYYSPEYIESKTLGLEIHKMNDIIFIYKKTSPNRILAMASLKDDIVYPPKGLQERAYYDGVQNLFSMLKLFLKNDNLELAR